MGSDIMQEEIMNIIKDGVITIPKILLYNYKKLNMNEIDLVLLIYLIPKNNQEFNPAVISKDLDIPINDVLLNIEHLTELNILKLQNKKIDGIRQERINIDNIYEKLLYLIVNKETEKKEDNNIFSSFETEFGRTLAPMEYEIINSWLDSGYEKELILSALKEAVYNGVFKLNYIDKILYEWNKKGIKTSKDIEKDKEKYTKKKEEKKELYDYNWLEEYE